MGWVCACCYIGAISLSFRNEMNTEIPAISGMTELTDRGNQVSFFTNRRFKQNDL